MQDQFTGNVTAQLCLFSPSCLATSNVGGGGSFTEIKIDLYQTHYRERGAWNSKLVALVLFFVVLFEGKKNSSWALWCVCVIMIYAS